MKIRIMEPRQEVKQKKKRVCAYARVSTDNRKQEESLENQGHLMSVSSGAIQSMSLLVYMLIRASPATVKAVRSSRKCWMRQEKGNLI